MSSTICDADSLTSPGSTKNPEWPSLTISGVSPTRVATHGTPQASDSIHVVGAPSMNEGNTETAEFSVLGRHILMRYVPSHDYGQVRLAHLVCKAAVPDDLELCIPDLMADLTEDL